MLVHPDPSKPFIVEADASDMGAGTVLSQHSGSPPKLQPCTFFSHRLSHEERNYDVGDRELLTVKLALEEWRHFFEGAEHPFIIWTITKISLTFTQPRDLTLVMFAGHYSLPDLTFLCLNK